MSNSCKLPNPSPPPPRSIGARQAGRERGRERKRGIASCLYPPLVYIPSLLAISPSCLYPQPLGYIPLFLSLVYIPLFRYMSFMACYEASPSFSLSRKGSSPSFSLSRGYDPFEIDASALRGKTSSHIIHLSISFRNSTPPHNRQLTVYYSSSKIQAETIELIHCVIQYRANSARIGQSSPDSAPSSQVKSLKTSPVVPASLGSALKHSGLDHLIPYRSRGRRSQTVGADCLTVCHPRDPHRLFPHRSEAH